MKRLIIANSTFTYSGPAYHFEKYLGDFQLTTEAPSKSKAKNNILYRIKKAADLDRTARVSILDENLKEKVMESPKQSAVLESPKLGTQLSLFEDEL